MARHAERRSPDRVHPTLDWSMMPIVLAVLAGVCWGVGEFFTKQVLHTKQVGPMTILLVRALMSVPPAIAAYVVAYSLLKSEPAEWWRRATPGVLTKLALGSALMAGFGGVFFFYLALGAAGGEISRVKPIAFALAPSVAAVLAWRFLGESMGAAKVAGIALILAGVVVLTSQGAHAPAAR